MPAVKPDRIRLATSEVRRVPIPQVSSAGQRWRFRRNLVIFGASQIGFSQRVLADVFDLPHSRIASIIKEFRAICPDVIEKEVGSGQEVSPR